MTSAVGLYVTWTGATGKTLAHRLGLPAHISQNAARWLLVIAGLGLLVVVALWNLLPGYLRAVWYQTRGYLPVRRKTHAVALARATAAEQRAENIRQEHAAALERRQRLREGIRLDSSQRHWPGHDELEGATIDQLRQAAARARDVDRNLQERVKYVDPEIYAEVYRGEFDWSFSDPANPLTPESLARAIQSRLQLVARAVEEMQGKLSRE